MRPELHQQHLKGIERRVLSTLEYHGVLTYEALLTESKVRRVERFEAELDYLLTIGKIEEPLAGIFELTQNF